MDIKLEQIKVFYTVATEGSFSEAAKVLFITQSAVSQQIKSLEQELGIMLFARGRKGAKLTNHGVLLFDYAKRSIDEIKSAENLFSRMKSLEEGSLRIGAGDTITRHFLLEKLAKFHSTYPAVKVEFINRVTDETLAKLIAGTVDVAFVNLPIDLKRYSNVEVKEIGSLHDIFIAGEKYSLLKDKPLSMSDIASLPLVMLEPKSNTRKVTDEYFNKHGITLEPEFELGSHDLLFHFAEKNFGIACVTEEFATVYESMSFFKLKTDFQIPKRSIGLCTLKNVSPAPSVIKLIEMFE